MSLRVALVSPNAPGSYRSSKIVAEDLAICMLASVVEAQGHTVTLHDARTRDLSSDDLFSRLEQVQPDVIGFTLRSGLSCEWTQDVCRLIHMTHPEAFVVLGGYYPTLQPQAALAAVPDAAAIVRGEGEVTFPDLLSALDERREWKTIPGTAYMDPSLAGVVVGPRRPPVETLDDLPWPKRYLAPRMSQQFEVLVEGSRGCPGRCTFCAIGPFFGSGCAQDWRARSPENIVAEMVAIKRLNPRLTRFRFVDPDFFGPDGTGARVNVMARLIAQQLPGVELYVEARANGLPPLPVLRELKRAGLVEVYLGVESGSPQILKKMNKRVSPDEMKSAVHLLRHLGIGTSYGFMMFTPWTREADIRQSLVLLRELGGVQFDKLFHAMDVIPGTPALGIAQKTVALQPKGKTGYLTYGQDSGVVRFLRRSGEAFETRHLAFMEELWFLYKDIQRMIQLGRSEGLLLESAASAMFLSMFEFLLDAYPGDDVAVGFVDSCVDDCVERFKSEAGCLVSRTDSTARFARPEEITVSFR